MFSIIKACLRDHITHDKHTNEKEKKISLPIFSSSQRFKYLVSTHTQGEKYRSQQQRDTQFNDKKDGGQDDWRRD